MSRISNLIYQKLSSTKSLAYVVAILIIMLIVGIAADQFLSIKIILVGFFAACLLLNIVLSHYVFKNITKIKDDYNQLTEFIQLNKRIHPETILPITRGYAGSPDFLNIILDSINDLNPKLIIEASCGVSSIVISDLISQKDIDTQHIALEHDEKYLNKCQSKIRSKRSKIIHAPLKDHQIEGKSWKWYDISKVEFSKKIDLLIIDGPPAHLQDNSRFPALPLLINHMAETATIIMDDFDRKAEQRIIKLWGNKYDFSVEYIPTEKGTGIIRLRK